jgi:AraC-like DNA-binding protein
MSRRLEQIQNWPELARQANWSVTLLAKHCQVSVRTLERVFTAKMGKPVKKWLVEQRLQKAVEFMAKGASVKETATQLAYKHPSHLANDCKKQWGCCPTSKTLPTRAQNP